MTKIIFKEKRETHRSHTIHERCDGTLWVTTSYDGLITSCDDVASRRRAVSVSGIGIGAPVVSWYRVSSPRVVSSEH